MPVLKTGDTAPRFTLKDDEGKDFDPSRFADKPVVLFFYPKDDTPGCTKQACGLRDVYGELQERGATVLGVSPDTEASHVKFKEKFSLPFTLLADPEHEVADLYGVWVEKNLYGKKSMGIKRSTFVIDADGNVAKAMRGVSPDGHADKVLAALPLP